MSVGNVSRVLRAPGRLIVDPLDDFGDINTSYPYGGTEVGKVNECSLTRSGLPPFPVEYEATGEVGDLLEGDNKWMFACFIRAWDRDAVEQFLSNEYSVGDYTQHAVFSVPGDSVPGSSSLGRAVKLAYIPDDEIHVPGALMYVATPNWTADAELAMRRQDEFGIPLTFICTRDSSDRILQVGIIADLSI